MHRQGQAGNPLLSGSARSNSGSTAARRSAGQSHAAGGMPTVNPVGRFALAASRSGLEKYGRWSATRRGGEHACTGRRRHTVVNFTTIESAGRPPARLTRRCTVPASQVPLMVPARPTDSRNLEASVDVPSYSPPGMRRVSQVSLRGATTQRCWGSGQCSGHVRAARRARPSEANGRSALRGCEQRRHGWAIGVAAGQHRRKWLCRSRWNPARRAGTEEDLDVERPHQGRSASSCSQVMARMPVRPARSRGVIFSCFGSLRRAGDSSYLAQPGLHRP